MKDGRENTKTIAEFAASIDVAEVEVIGAYLEHGYAFDKNGGSHSTLLPEQLEALRRIFPVVPADHRQHDVKMPASAAAPPGTGSIPSSAAESAHRTADIAEPPGAPASSSLSRTAAEPAPDTAANKYRPKLVLVDAANVAHAEKGADGKPRLRNLLLVRDSLAKATIPGRFIADASLRHRIDDRPAFDSMVAKNDIVLAPARTRADVFLLDYARQLGADIISNDQYKEYVSTYRDEITRVHRFMILDGVLSLDLKEPS